MKFSRLAYIIIGLLMIACSGDEAVETDKEEDIKNPVNKAPSKPVLVSPQQDLACAYSTLNFEWQQSQDPEDDAIRYVLEVAEDQDFQRIYERVETIDTFKDLELEKGMVYFWRVRAKDDQGSLSDHSETRSFYTEPRLSYNTIPEIPYAESPSNNSSIEGTGVLLKWTAADQDGDSLSFDVYLSNTYPPSLYKADVPEPELLVEVQDNENYFWRIAAKDNKGAKAFGPVWSFDTNY
ncbi:fibronectin type III domain-containing protein [Gramella sp. GC03-9]|uniref:Fibronectin type III domain-containing protein n=1 Tax=Christiangramia oceanisediminis TaxID=2920386 RepID=A0A9X2REH6_9FLAO|nr:fibronectin type III domain-containing protein [Gramella oceanisediminis]MCP9201356.1 fibronectin type III domain-containing protein [Gramella oceanisediminis]